VRFHLGLDTAALLSCGKTDQDIDCLSSQDQTTAGCQNCVSNTDSTRNEASVNGQDEVKRPRDLILIKDHRHGNKIAETSSHSTIGQGEEDDCGRSIESDHCLALKLTKSGGRGLSTRIKNRLMKCIVKQVMSRVCACFQASAKQCEV
jgi:hypothetical protein